MAYIVKKLAAMSGVSVRTLHFYDKTGLLKPACYGGFTRSPNGSPYSKSSFTGEWRMIQLT